MPSIRYSATQKFLHWFIFLLVLLVYGLTYAEGLFERGDPGRDTVWWLHMSFGLLLLALVFVRIAVRVGSGAPEDVAGTSPLGHWAAHAIHFALYVLLIAIPLSGIALAALRDMPLSFFGLFTLPAPLAPNRAAVPSVQEVHELLANLILVVAGLHALAALWHHYVRHDEVLRRMMPER